MATDQEGPEEAKRGKEKSEERQRERKTTLEGNLQEGGEEG